MRAPLLPVFLKYTTDHEGYTPFLYADGFNLVTSGIGNLLDNSARNSFDTSANAMAPAMGLPWKFRAPGWSSKNPLAGTNASQTDIMNAWIAVKLQEQVNPGFNQKGGGAYAGLTQITLDIAGINKLVNDKIASNELILRKEYPGYESLPIDAQFGLNSMSWAMGPAFWPALRPHPELPANTADNIPYFQAFKDAIDKGDFTSAAKHSQFKGGGSLTDAGVPGVRPSARNHDLVIMFNNAASSVKVGASPDLLIFPGTSVSGPGGIASVAIPGLWTTRNVVGGGLAGGLIVWGLHEWWKDSAKSKRKRT